MISANSLVLLFVAFCFAKPHRGSFSTAYSQSSSVSGQRPQNTPWNWSQPGQHWGSWDRRGQPPPRRGPSTTAWSSPSFNNTKWGNQFPPSRPAPSQPANRIFPTPNTLPMKGCQEGNKLYKTGDKWTPEGGCGRYTCLDGGKTTFLGCPKPEAGDGCSVVEANPQQPWPVCCPQVQCPASAQ